MGKFICIFFNIRYCKFYFYKVTIFLIYLAILVKYNYTDIVFVIIIIIRPPCITSLFMVKFWSNKVSRCYFTRSYYTTIPLCKLNFCWNRSTIRNLNVCAWRSDCLPSLSCIVIYLYRKAFYGIFPGISS